MIDEKVMTSTEEPDFVKTLTGAASMAESEARDEADEGKAWTLNFLAGKLRDASFVIDALTKLRDDKIAMGWQLVPPLSLGTRITLADGTEAVVVRDWQDISTAPKTYSPPLSHYNHHAPQILGLYGQAWYSICSWGGPSAPYWIGGDNKPVPFQPTRWMPLPELSPDALRAMLSALEAK